MDLLTWRALVSHSLSDLYGLLGEARHFDILVHTKTPPSLSAVIRIHSEDETVFRNSLTYYSFRLDNFLGRDYAYGGNVKVVAHLPYLGALADRSLLVQ